MDDILFQLDLIWEIFLKNVSNISYDMNNRGILLRLWSIQFFFKSVFNASFKNSENDYQFFKDDMKATVDDIVDIHDQWIKNINILTKEELHSTKYCKWPFDNRSFFSLALWVNLELAKYVYEIEFIQEKNSG